MVDPCNVVDWPRAIETDADLNACRLDRFDPVLIETGTIGLNGEGDGHSGPQTAARFVAHPTELAPTDQRRLSAMKQDRNRPLAGGAAIAFNSVDGGQKR